MKLTPWFVNGEKPARPGVYNVSCRKTDQSGAWYAYWDERKGWRTARRYPNQCSPRGAVASGRGSVWSVQGAWRGLAEEPRT